MPAMGSDHRVICECALRGAVLAFCCHHLLSVPPAASSWPLEPWQQTSSNSKEQPAAQGPGVPLGNSFQHVFLLLPFLPTLSCFSSPLSLFFFCSLIFKDPFAPLKDKGWWWETEQEIPYRLAHSPDGAISGMGSGRSQEPRAPSRSLM